MGNRNGLTSGSRNGFSGWRFNLTSLDSTVKPAANSFSGIELATGVRTSPGNESPGSVVVWSLSFK